MLLCDVDHFKLVNDRYGHQVGDEVLQEVAARLQLAVRHKDFVGRYGGEEFLIVLNQCRPSDVAESADRIRRSICDTPITTSAGPLTVSISLGANSIPQGNSYPTIESIIREADLKLYEAKAAGRNRTCVVESAAIAA